MAKLDPKALLRRNGDDAKPLSLGAPTDLPRIAQLFGPLVVTAEQLRQFPKIDGSDEEPWDVLLSMLAMDEHQALDLLARRTGLRFVPEPRIHESSGRFSNLLPPTRPRHRPCAGPGGAGPTLP